jgi:hypothetical protein
MLLICQHIWNIYASYMFAYMSHVCNIYFTYCVHICYIYAAYMQTYMCCIYVTFILLICLHICHINIIYLLLLCQHVWNIYLTYIQNIWNFYKKYMPTFMKHTFLHMTNTIYTSISRAMKSLCLGIVQSRIKHVCYITGACPRCDQHSI